MNYKSLLHKEIFHGGLSDIMQIGLVSHEITSHMNAKFPDAELKDSSEYIISYLRKHRWISSIDYYSALEDFRGRSGHQRIKDKNREGSEYIVFHTHGSIYYTGSVGDHARILYEIEDGYKRFYRNGKKTKKVPFQLKFPLMLRRLVWRKEMSYEELIRVVNERAAKNGTSKNWYNSKLEKLVEIGLMKKEGDVYKPTERLLEIYSSKKQNAWRKLRDWEHRVELVTQRKMSRI